MDGLRDSVGDAVTAPLPDIRTGDAVKYSTGDYGYMAGNVNSVTGAWAVVQWPDGMVTDEYLRDLVVVERCNERHKD